MKVLSLRFNLFLLASTVLAVNVSLGWNEPQILNPEKQQESADGSEQSPITVDENETIFVEKVVPAMVNKNPWEPPNFSKQEGALGWHPEVFNVPPGMRERVDFWRDIYTKYSTDQGVLHDSLHIGVVYEVLDFRAIMNDKALTDGQKRKARKKLVETKKKEIRERLARLARVKSASEISGDDLRIWNLFSKFDEADKFTKAMHKKRLRFQLGQSDRFLLGIYYSGRYIRPMEKIFREAGLPIELTRLPFVESSFNVNARSRVGASGIWQFMRYTGKKFMRINNAVDERNDPIRAAEAAARLFKINYSMLNSWPLAITGYNHGPSGVQRVVRKFSTDKIEELVDERHGRFGFASANFYACFLAALEAERNAKKYFGDRLYWDSQIDAKEIKLTRRLSRKILLSWFNDNQDLAKNFNPHIQRGFWTGYISLNEKDFVRIPSAKYEQAQNDLKNLNQAQLAMGSDKPAGSDGTDYYQIGPGETLSEIASQLGVSVNILKELNGIDNPRGLRAGQKILVPRPKQN